MNRVLIASRTVAAVALLIGPVALARGDPEMDEIRAIVAEMLAEAESRSSLLAGGVSGHDGSFNLASDDGAFRLSIGGGVQFRSIMGFRDDDDADDFTTGFQARRTQLRFHGTVHSDWLYFVEGEFEADGGAFNLNDAYAGYKLSSRVTLLAGQLKAPLLREEVVEDRYQLGVERSLTNDVFSQGRSQGVAGVYCTDSIQFIGAFSDGAATEDTDYGTTAPVQSDWALSGRLNWKIGGDWGAFCDFTSERGSPFAGMIGAAVHYQQSANTGNPGDTDVNVLLYTVDAQIEGDGWNFFAAFIGRNIETNSLAADADFDDFGGVVQAGFHVTAKTELFLRYDVILPDSDRLNNAGSGDADAFSTMTAGVNYYIAGHAAKLSADVQYNFDALTDSALIAPNTGSGYLGSREDGELAIRLQLQVLF